MNPYPDTSGFKATGRNGKDNCLPVPFSSYILTASGLKVSCQALFVTGIFSYLASPSLTIITLRDSITLVIATFACKKTEKIFRGQSAKGWSPALQRKAYKKLAMLHSAGKLADLRSPPDNHLEKLKGDRSGQYSIRVNNQWRLVFEWQNNNAYDVEMIDYH